MQAVGNKNPDTLMDRLKNISNSVVPASLLINQAPQFENFKCDQFSSITSQRLSQLFRNTIASKFGNDLWGERQHLHLEMLAKLLIDMRDSSGVFLSYSLISETLNFKNLLKQQDNNSLSDKVKNSLVSYLAQIPGGSLQQYQYVAMPLIAGISKSHFLVKKELKVLCSLNSKTTEDMDTIVKFNSRYRMLSTVEMVAVIESGGGCRAELLHLLDAHGRRDILSLDLGI